MKKSNLVFLFLVVSISVFAQKENRPGYIKRYINNLINDTSESSEPQFIFYPTLAYAPETSWEFGFSGLFVYYAKKDTSNRLSEISGFTFFTLAKQYGLWIENALYTDKDKWFILGKSKFQSYPLEYHGIGINASKEHIAVVDAISLQVKQRLLRKVWGNFYMGPEFDFQQLSSVNFKLNKTDSIPLPLGNRGSANLGAGLGLVYDTRHNVLNVRHGVYSELAYINYNKGIGSQFDFSTVTADLRLYKSINKRDVLAFQAFGQFNKGTVPFNQLALMGGENIMRGCYLGRFRDKNLVATQLEYRMLPLPFKFTKRWGLSGFIAAGTIADKAINLNINKTIVAGGGGIRFLLFPKKDVFTRLDVAFTRESTGIYIFIGEAF